VSLDGSVALAAVELTGQWLSVGVGTLSGELHYTERVALPTDVSARAAPRAGAAGRGERIS